MSTQPVQQPVKSGLSPDTSLAQQHLTALLNGNSIITGYATVMINSVVTKIDGQGAWYDTFSANLATAQGHAEQWLTPIGPDFFSVVPNAIVKYGTTFTNAMNAVLNISNNPAEPDGVTLSPVQIREILELVGACLATLKELRGAPGVSNIGVANPTIEGVYTDLTNFLNNIQDDNRNLTSAQDGAQKEVGLDEGTIETLKEDIKLLNADISALNTELTAAEAGTGLSIFVALAGFGLAVVTAGAGAVVAGVVGGVAVVGLGLSIAGDVIFTKKINADLAKIQSDNDKLTTEKAQVASLQQIILSIGTLSAANLKAQSAVEDLLDTWKALEDKLGDVLQDLQQADSKSMIAILESLFIEDAIADWQSLAKYANGILGTTVNMLKLQQPKN